MQDQRFTASESVVEEGVYRALTTEGRQLATMHLPAGAYFPPLNTAEKVLYEPIVVRTISY
jgi:hypothetical protein